jgi:hypothetical protein
MLKPFVKPQIVADGSITSTTKASGKSRNIYRLVLLSLLFVGLAPLPSLAADANIKPSEPAHLTSDASSEDTENQITSPEPETLEGEANFEADQATEGGVTPEEDEAAEPQGSENPSAGDNQAITPDNEFGSQSSELESPGNRTSGININLNINVGNQAPSVEMGGFPGENELPPEGELPAEDELSPVMPPNPLPQFPTLLKPMPGLLKPKKLKMPKLIKNLKPKAQKVKKVQKVKLNTH